MYDKESILVLENNDSLREALIAGLKLRGFDVEGASDLEEALTRVNNRTYHVALVDLMLRDPSDMSIEGLAVLKRLNELGEGTQALVLSGQKSPQVSADTLQEYKATRYVAKSDVIDHGPEFLFNLVIDLIQSTEMNRYGEADDALSFIAGKGTDSIVWQDHCLRVLKPKEGYAGLRRFLEELCNPLAPLMPGLHAAERMVIEEKEHQVRGRFWSKGLGLPVEVLICPSDRSSELVDSGVIGKSPDVQIVMKHEKYGLTGYVIKIEAAAREEFTDKLEKPKKRR